MPEARFTPTQPEGTVPEHHSVVVIGGGQAGLSISWHLTRLGLEHVVLDRETTGHEWRSGRWENFTLVTPNWQCQLPGYSYAGDDPDGFMPREDVHDFVRGYAASFGAPVRERVAVTSLRQEPGRTGFALSTTAGELTADQVVIATGGYHLPIVPTLAERLPADLHQIHSSEYKSSSQLPEGAVLVVGSGQSGAQIAEDLHLEGRQVHLAVGGAPRVARFYRGRDCVAWLDDLGTYDVPVQAQPNGLAARDKTNHYVTGRDGGRDIDLRAFATQGMQLHGRVVGGSGHQLQLAPGLERSLDAADAVMEGIKDLIDAHIERQGIVAPAEARYTPQWRPQSEHTELDLAAAGITSVVWCIGYRADYRWVQVGVFDGLGAVRHERGVTGVPGLYFLGLPWLHTWGSGRFAGVARDAEHLAEALASVAVATTAA